MSKRFLERSVLEQYEETETKRQKIEDSGKIATDFLIEEKDYLHNANKLSEYFKQKDLHGDLQELNKYINSVINDTINNPNDRKFFCMVSGDTFPFRFAIKLTDYQYGIFIRHHSKNWDILKFSTSEYYFIYPKSYYVYSLDDGLDNDDKNSHNDDKNMDIAKNSITEDDIKTVMTQAEATRDAAIRALTKNDGDIVNSIMYLTGIGDLSEPKYDEKHTVNVGDSIFPPMSEYGKWPYSPTPSFYGAYLPTSYGAQQR